MILKKYKRCINEKIKESARLVEDLLGKSIYPCVINAFFYFNIIEKGLE